MKLLTQGKTYGYFSLRFNKLTCQWFVSEYGSRGNLVHTYPFCHKQDADQFLKFWTNEIALDTATLRP